MSEPGYRNSVLNPCPKCGKQIDCNGCMTFVDYFLEKVHDGKCPACGTQVVIQVKDNDQPEEWNNAIALADIREVAIKKLHLSVRTVHSLDQLGCVTIGDLLNITKTEIRESLPVGEPVINEVVRLLEHKGLSIQE